MHTESEGELGRVMARSSGLLLSDQTVESVLGLLTATAMHVLPTAEGAGITLLSPEGARTTMAGTDETVRRADALQYELEEGPCIDAWMQRHVIQVDDLGTETRWPRWAPAAADLGLRSVMSSGLVTGEEGVGALKLYSDRPGAFTEPDQATVRMFAAQAAILVHSVRTFHQSGRLSEDLQAALTERDTIAKATGLIMGRENVPQDTALTYLMSRAQGEDASVYKTAKHLLRSVERDR